MTLLRYGRCVVWDNVSAQFSSEAAAIEAVARMQGLPFNGTCMTMRDYEQMQWLRSIANVTS